MKDIQDTLNESLSINESQSVVARAEYNLKNAYRPEREVRDIIEMAIARFLNKLKVNYIRKAFDVDQYEAKVYEVAIREVVNYIDSAVQAIEDEETAEQVVDIIKDLENLDPGAANEIIDNMFTDHRKEMSAVDNVEASDILNEVVSTWNDLFYNVTGMKWL